MWQHSVHYLYVHFIENLISLMEQLFYISKKNPQKTLYVLPSFYI